MIRHIVLFRLRAEDAAGRLAAEEGIRARLTALVGVVPGLQRLEIGRDIGTVPGHWDLVLVSEHDDAAALEGYQAHDAHRTASAWVAEQVADRAVVDYPV